MTDNQGDLNQFIVALLEGAHRQIKLATADLTDEQLYYQPTTETNSIAWLMWHLSRWRDRISATISGASEVWSCEGWAQRCGLSSEGTGLGDTPAQVTAFRVPREALFGYLDAAHQATVACVTHMMPQQFAQPMVFLPGDTRPTWRALVGVCGDSVQHTGQINYLRGIVTGYGWRSRVGLH